MWPPRASVRSTPLPPTTRLTVAPRTDASKSWSAEGNWRGLCDPVVVVSGRFRGGLGRRVGRRQRIKALSEGQQGCRRIPPGGCRAMSHVHWWLFALSFVLGLCFTLALLARPVRRRVRERAPVRVPQPEPVTERLPLPDT